jgi:hypothetical protein
MAGVPASSASAGRVLIYSKWKAISCVKCCLENVTGKMEYYLKQSVVGIGEDTAEPIDERLYVEHRLAIGFLHHKNMSIVGNTSLLAVFTLGSD